MLEVEDIPLGEDASSYDGGVSTVVLRGTGTVVSADAEEMTAEIAMDEDSGILADREVVFDFSSIRSIFRLCLTPCNQATGLRSRTFTQRTPGDLCAASRSFPLPTGVMGLCDRLEGGSAPNRSSYQKTESELDGPVVSSFADRLRASGVRVAFAVHRRAGQKGRPLRSP